MKKIILTVVLIITAISLFAQISNEIKLDEAKYKCTYLLTYQPDSTDIELIKQEEMILFIGDKISEFISSGLYKQDSLKSVFIKNMNNPEYKNPDSLSAKKMFGMDLPHTHFNEHIFKNYPKGKITVTEDILLDNFKYVDSVGLFNWVIKNNTKKIGNYICREADCYFAGRNYTAWFTDEIPLSEGPYKFSGLPGLIIVLYDENNQYKYELLSMKKLSELVNIEISDDKYINTNKHEFFRLKEEFNKNAFDRMEDAGIFFGNPVTNKEKQKIIIKMNNNSVEL
ncbi:MAG: GLPGLI family protein [Chlorobi bacterium]|nr:GLPGLI family protein [Chlorobiota bacterium]